MQNGMIIKMLRENKKISQQIMARILRVNHTDYKLYEASLQPMKLVVLNRVSNYFKVSLDYLLNISKRTNFKDFKEYIDYNLLSFNLVFIRKKANITQKELAKCFRMSPTSISNYERNPYLIPITYLYMFAKKFNISIDYLVGKSTKKEIL